MASSAQKYSPNCLLLGWMSQVTSRTVLRRQRLSCKLCAWVGGRWPSAITDPPTPRFSWDSEQPWASHSPLLGVASPLPSCSSYHRIIERFGLGATFRGCLVQPPCNEQGHLQPDQAARSPSNLALNVSRDGSMWFPP